MSDIICRRATSNDLETVRQLVNESWRAAYADAIAAADMEAILDRRHAPQLLREQFDVADDVFLVAESNGKIVGHAYATHRSDSLYLDRLHVEPGLNGKGIGKKLMAEVFAAARDAEPVTVEVIDSNHRARRFYETLGFRIIERTASCNGEMGVAALVMRRPAG